jgi:hypothetical protein
VHVSPSGKVVPFGPGFGRYSVITGMVVNPDSASVAVAILRQDRHWNPRHPEQGRRPGVIVLVGLPGHPPNEGKWILDSSTATQADSLSWRDDTHLTYIPGSDETGGGFAGRGAVTLDVAAASRVAPATSRWPVPSKAPGSCNLVSGTWFEPPGGHVASYLALEACAAGGGDVLVQVNPVTGRQLSRRARVHGFGCPSQPLDPQPGEAIVLVSFCGLQLYQPGSAVQQLHGLSDAAFAG